MTAYFDQANAEIREASERAGGDALAFLDALMVIEKRVIRDVQLNTGDREFPEDLREVILGTIATEACTGALPDDGFYEEARAVAIAGLSELLCRPSIDVVRALLERRMRGTRTLPSHMRRAEQAVILAALRYMENTPPSTITLVGTVS
jgi:hypothetical protein